MSPALKPPPHGAAPAPCQPPERAEALVVGQVKGTARWWKRIRPHSTSPNAVTASVIPALTLKRRLSSARPLPHPEEEQVAQATSPPGHSRLPSPLVNWSAQTCQFIEPEVSKTSRMRALTTLAVKSDSS